MFFQFCSEYKMKFTSENNVHVYGDKLMKYVIKAWLQVHF